MNHSFELGASGLGSIGNLKDIDMVAANVFFTMCFTKTIHQLQLVMLVPYSLNTENL